MCDAASPLLEPINPFAGARLWERGADMAGLGCRGVAGIASLRVLVWGCLASDCFSSTPCWLEAVGIRCCWGRQEGIEQTSG